MKKIKIIDVSSNYLLKLVSNWINLKKIFSLPLNNFKF